MRRSGVDRRSSGAGSVGSLLMAALLIVGCGSGETGPVGGSNPPPDGPAEGAPCSTEGEQTGITNGTLQCTRDASTGALMWVRMGAGIGNGGDGGSGSGGDGGNGSGGDNPKSLRVGEACSTNGLIGFADSLLTVCRNGTVAYALYDDVPARPAGGYTSRPNWYPTLGDMFGPKVDECPNGKVMFTVTPLPADHITRTVPAGMMIGGHVTPIDHLYIGIDTLERDTATMTDADFVPVVAPADGFIVDVGVLNGGVFRVVMVHGCNIVSVFMVVNRLTGVLADVGATVANGGRIEQPVAIKAGEEFGRQRDNPLDFNIFDGATWLPGLANPFSYAEGEAWKPYTADPARVFVPDVWSVFESSMQRTVEPRWGKIDYDVVGSASGSWFLDGTLGYSGLMIADVASATSMMQGGGAPGKNDASWSHLSISPHPVDPTRWIFSTGSWSDPNGDAKQLAIDLGGFPPPDGLTEASGSVVYRLAQPSVVSPDAKPRQSGSKAPDPIGYTVGAGPQTEGWVVVQVIDDDHLGVEVVVGNVPRPTGFTAAKLTYHR